MLRGSRPDLTGTKTGMLEKNGSYVTVQAICKEHAVLVLPRKIVFKHQAIVVESAAGLGLPELCPSVIFNRQSTSVRSAQVQMARGR